jgi:hypothetical protein
MAVPTSITDCNATAANNSPAGSDSIGTSLDDYLRAHAAIIRQAYDALVVVDGTLLPKAGGSVTGTITTTHQIKGITPVANEDLARKDYVDSQLGGSGPAFYAYGGGTASSHGAYTVQLPTEVFDTNSAYNPTTGEFTPQVGGYYNVSLTLVFNAFSTLASQSLQLYKNNSLYNAINAPTVQTYPSNMSYSTLVYMNGTTDYITTKYYQTTGGSITPNSCQFSACFVRS